MATSKAEYLKRYMSVSEQPDVVTKKKRRKKITAGGKSRSTGFKIIDEDIDMSKIRAGGAGVEDEEPTVAEIIDERPDAVKHMEEFVSSKKWKTLAADSAKSFNKPSKDCNISSHSPSPKNDADNSPPRRKQHDSDDSLPRRNRHDSDNSSPPRKRQDSDNSPPHRKQRHESDNSPPRRKRHDSDNSPPRRKRHDSDNSPPRRKRHDSDNSPPRRKRHDSDNSPPRRQRPNASPLNKSDSDQSPPRRTQTNLDSSGGADKDSASQKKTLSGKAAGLSSAKLMKQEAEQLRLKELEMFNRIGDDKLGRNADTVFRDKTGKKRDLKSEKQEDDAKQAEWKQKYDKWAKGIAQGTAEQERVAEMVHEMSKPLARDKDDADLDAYLKEQVHADDPMLAFIKKKKDAKSNKPKYPQYKGRAPEPNRYGIRPGYRWDGVDRGNGFEKKYFQSISKRKAISAEAYKWSTEDM